MKTHVALASKITALVALTAVEMTTRMHGLTLLLHLLTSRPAVGEISVLVLLLALEVSTGVPGFAFIAHLWMILRHRTKNERG